MRRWFALIAVITACTATGGAAAPQTAAAPAQASQSWPRMNDPVFAVLAPIDKIRSSGATPRQVLAELDRLATQIAASNELVQARASYIRAQMLWATADLPGATRAALEARTLAARARHPVIECDALILLTTMAADRGDLETAASRVTEAAKIAETAGDDILRYNVRLDQGRIARMRGRGREALVPLTEASAIGEKVGAIRMRIQPRISLSSVRLGLSDYDGALGDAQAAYGLSTGEGVPADLRGAAALALAQTLSQIGDLESGLDLYEDAIGAYSKVGLLAGVALAVRQRMDARLALSDYEGAAEDGARALQLFVKTGSQGQEPAVLSRMALIHARLGRADAATYQQRAEAAMAAAVPRVRAQIESDLANSALERRQFADATVRFSRLLDQAKTLRDLEIEWRALQGLGSAALGGNNLAQAQVRFEAAIAVVDRIRRSLPEAGLRADFIAERLGPYDGLISTLLARSTSPGDAHAVRAFEVSEQARGRALADLLAEARQRATDPGIAGIRDRDVAFGRRISDLQQSLAAAGTDAERKKLVADLDRAEREYRNFIVRIRRETPRYAALAHARAVPAAEVAKGLGAGEALASFWVGRDRGVGWWISKSGIRSYRLPGRQTLDRDVARLRSAIAGGQIAEIEPLAAALHATLFPIADSQTRQLIIVPDGPLWRLPFAALSTGPGGQWLVRRMAFSVVPSASLLSALPIGAASAERRPGVVFGIEQVPANVRALRSLYDERLLPSRPLTYAADEALAVGKALGPGTGTQVFMNERADETAFKRATVAPLRVVHVASHALIDDRAPRRTALVLASSQADDGLLQLNEIANLQLDADLVVLSTCQSQLGRAIRGEGLVSLSRAFIHGGARGVVASIWSVDDRETSRLMPLMYAALRGGAAPADALRAAQLAMLKAGGPSASPASWAGFVVMGQGRRRVF
jgi:tetratricopeptide (TPR) repeat protein